MKIVDLTSLVKFQTQFDTCFGTKKEQNVSCAKACKLSLTKEGYGIVDGTKRKDVLVWNDKKELKKATSYDEAMKLLNDQLDNNLPTIVGVNRSTSTVGNVNKATSHFVVVVGRIEEGKYTGYRFYDPGTSFESKGTSTENILWLREDGIASGNSKYTSRLYTLTEVRPTIAKK